MLFDLGGVVVEMESDRLMLQVSQLVGKSLDEVQAAVYDKELMVPFETGDLTPKAYYEGLTQRLGLSWTYERFVGVWTGIFQENRDVTQILGRLRKWHKLTALSNTNTLHVEWMKRSIPSLEAFHDWVASCDVGVRKPDPRIYQLALDRAGVRAQRAVYVDDRPELVEAGKMLGLKAIRFESSRQLEQDLQALGLNL